MNVLRNWLTALSVLAIGATSLQAQCGNWNESARKNDAENAHVIYRPFLNGKEVADIDALNDENFGIAFNNWKLAYELAPAADGQRVTHYEDGRTLYQSKMNRTEDPALKKEYAAKVVELFDAQLKCYPKDKSYYLGRKGYDMFYYLGYGYVPATYDALVAAVDDGGNDTEYIVFDPLAQVMVYLFKTNQLTKEQVRSTYEKMDAIMQHNIENNGDLSQYFKDVKAIVTSNFTEIESQVFDCNYFKEKLIPQYRKNENDLEIIQYVYLKLKKEGCDSLDVVMVELRDKYEVLAIEINKKLEADRRISDPVYDAIQLQKEGKYREAVARYQEGIDKADDKEVKAQCYYSIAFIQTWQLQQYTTARDNARKAASLKSSWGKPYVLIGDMYAKTSRNCGDDWQSRLAILAALEKYSYAKSIDSSVSDDVNDRYRNYAGSKPDKETGFMLGVKEGQQAKVECWIGETVTVRY